MKFARICIFAYFVVFAAAGSSLGQPCPQPPNVCGQLEVSASAEMKAESVQTHPSSVIDADESKDPSVGGSNTGVLLAEANASAVANTSRAGAIAFGSVEAKVGDISLEGRATVLGRGLFREHGTLLNGAPSLGIRGGTGEAEAFLSAGVKDFVSFTTNSMPVGNRLLIRSRLKIKGGFSPFTTVHKFTPFPGPPFIPTPPDSGGSVEGSLIMTASKGAFFAEPFSVDSLGPIVDLGHVIKNIAQDINSPTTPEIYWTFIAPNKQTDVMGYGLALTMRAFADASTDAGITGDFHGSIHWGGIVSVENADTGEVITDWTVTSASGFDYSKPFSPEVPEPASVALVGTALCVIFARWRTHSRRS